MKKECVLVLLVVLFSFWGIHSVEAERKAFWYVGTYGNAEESISTLVEKVKNKDGAGLYRDSDGWTLVAVYPASYDNLNLLQEIDASTDMLKPYSVEHRYGYIKDSVWQQLISGYSVGLKVVFSDAYADDSCPTDWGSVVAVWPKSNRTSCTDYRTRASLNPNTWGVNYGSHLELLRDENAGCDNGGIDYSLLIYHSNLKVMAIYWLSDYKWFKSDMSAPLRDTPCHQKDLFAKDGSYVELWIK